MSAYDMIVSDSIYGEESNGRYVSRSRLEKMLDREYPLLVERVAEGRPKLHSILPLQTQSLLKATKLKESVTVG